MPSFLHFSLSTRSLFAASIQDHRLFFLLAFADAVFLQSLQLLSCAFKESALRQPFGRIAVWLRLICFCDQTSRATSPVSAGGFIGSAIQEIPCCRTRAIALPARIWANIRIADILIDFRIAIVCNKRFCPPLLLLSFKCYNFNGRIGVATRRDVEGLLETNFLIAKVRRLCNQFHFFGIKPCHDIGAFSDTARNNTKKMRRHLSSEWQPQDQSAFVFMEAYFGGPSSYTACGSPCPNVCPKYGV